jgi:hypothetical protein
VRLRDRSEFNTRSLVQIMQDRCTRWVRDLCADRIKVTPTRQSPQFVAADADRIKALADELVKVQTREREIKQEMKELLR